MHLRGAGSALEQQLAGQIKTLRLIAPVTEYRFCRDQVGHGPGIRERLLKAGLKDWRLEFGWPSKMFDVEVEGGAYIMGRHNRGTGFEEDLKKYHAAQMFGWTIYRCSAPLIKSGQAVALIEKILKQRAE